MGRVIAAPGCWSCRRCDKWSSMGRVITVPGRRGFSLPSLNPLPAGFSAVAFPTGVAALRSNQLDLPITYSFSVALPSSHRSLHVFPPLVLEQPVFLFVNKLSLMRSFHQLFMNDCLG